MKAMVLAAGKGTRVRPITNIVPKPMIPLIGKPIMQTIVEHLRDLRLRPDHGEHKSFGAADRGLLRRRLEFWCRDGLLLRRRAHSGRLEGEAIGSAGGMKRIQDFSGFFDDTFVVLCGDALVDVDLQAAVRFHRDRGALATIIMRDVPREEVFRYGVVATAPDGKVLQFQEKPSVEAAVSTTINTGIYLFEPAIFDYIPAGRPFDIGGELFPALVAAGAPIYGVNLPFEWVDIGSVPDYWEASRLALSGKIKGYRLPGTRGYPWRAYWTKCWMGSRAGYDSWPCCDRREYIHRRWRRHRGTYTHRGWLRDRAWSSDSRVSPWQVHARKLFGTARQSPDVRFQLHRSIWTIHRRRRSRYRVGH